ncbi:unnamed protein product, partial [Effrenium voratum]
GQHIGGKTAPVACRSRSARRGCARGQQWPGPARSRGGGGPSEKATSQLGLAQVVAEADRVLEDNGTVKETKAVLRGWSSTWVGVARAVKVLSSGKAQKIYPGKWTLSGKKDELQQKLREFVEEAKATKKGLEEDSHRAQVTSWHPGRGGVASRASPQQDSGAEDWLAKSREEVEAFGEEEVLSWAEAVLNEGKVRDELIQQTVTALQQQGVTGKSLLKLTLEELMAAPYNIPGGPAKLLAEKIRLLQEPEDPLAIMANSEHTVEGLLRLRACLKEKQPASVHGEPNNGEFQARRLESQGFLNRVSKMLGDRSRSGSLTKADSPLLEYATMSGAGKSRWGFEVERLLKRNQSFQSYAVSRIGLNFNGGTGGGGADGTETEYLFEQQGFSLQQIMATLLLARGLLQCSPDSFRGKENWLRALRVNTVLDAVFKSFAHSSERKSILVVHVDELALLLEARKFDDRQLKHFVNVLAEYNCQPNPSGLVVPVITHTAPVEWDPKPTVIPLERRSLFPFNFGDSQKFFPGLNTTGLDSRRAISACGGHAALLVELRRFMQRQSGGLGALLTCNRVSQHRKSLQKIEQLGATCNTLVRAVLLQDALDDHQLQDFRRFFQLGLLFTEVNEFNDTYRITVPYPCFLNLLMQLDRPERFNHLRHEDPTGTDRRWSSKSFEALCAMRVAIDMDGFPYDLPCDPRAAAIEFRRNRKSRVFLAESDTELGVDSIGFDGNTMTLVQSKYPEADTTQEWKEIREFMNFAKTTGVDWAKSANCTRICAIFATARASRNYESEWPMELNVQEVVITYVIYAKTQNSRTRAVRTKQIDEWIPPGLMCM